MALRPVTPDDYPFLYELLKEKEPEQNISHTHLPTYEQHVAFNEGNPYAEDYIIGDNQGRIYLTRANEVGIHIAKGHRGTGLAQAALTELISKHPGESIYANIAPLNIRSKLFFKQMGFRLIQETYKLGA